MPRASVPPRARGVRARLVSAALVLALVPALPACGGASPREAYVPFVATFPASGSGGPHGGGVTPSPAPPRRPVWTPSAFPHARSVPLGSFPSDVVRFGETLFTSDADQVEADGAWIVPVDVSGPFPVDSLAYPRVRVPVAALVDSAGGAADATQPIGLGFYLNEILVVDERLGFVLANAGGSDSSPTLSNLVAFDPATGALRQVVDLAHPLPSAGLTDSAGAAVPGPTFRQSGAEGLEYVETAPGQGRLWVAMTNLLFGPPSYGTVKYPGTLQVFDVALGATVPVTARPRPGLVTETVVLGGYNPVAIQAFTSLPGPFAAPAARVLVTQGGATAFDAGGDLVPTTDSAVLAFDGATAAPLGTFALGPAGLAGIRPALGRDGAGHRVGYFPSATNGEVYLLLLDGLYAADVDGGAVAVLRGPENGIPVAADEAGSPGGNVTGIGLAPDGRTLVVAGFGNLFAFPAPTPGRLYLLGLPADVVGGGGFGADFVPGATEYATVPGRALGSLVLVPNPGGRPDVYVNVSGPIDPATFLGTGPGSLGTLQTFGLIR